MDSPTSKELDPTHPTLGRSDQRKRDLEPNDREIELEAEALEERIMPKLASNHNLTFLIDR